MPTSRREHDSAHREIFAHPKAIEDLLNHYIEEPWVAELDFTTLKRETEISVTRRRGTKLRDMVWSLQLHGQELFILVMIEFQSRNDPAMSLRLADYAATLYYDLLKQQRLTVDGRLPPMLPIVLYDGTRPWTAPRSLEEMIAEVPAGLARYQLALSYIVLDELRTPFTFEEQEVNVIASLLALQQGQDSDQVLRTVCVLVQLLRAPEHESLRQAFKAFILKVLPTEYAPIAEVFDQPEKAMTLAERLIRNEKRERAAAHKKGRQEGRQEGQRSLLAKLLQLKFGNLDAKTQERLADADLPLIQLWAERILKARTLEEVTDDKGLEQFEIRRRSGCRRTCPRR